MVFAKGSLGQFGLTHGLTNIKKLCPVGHTTMEQKLVMGLLHPVGHTMLEHKLVDSEFSNLATMQPDGYKLIQGFTSLD